MIQQTTTKKPGKKTGKKKVISKKGAKKVLRRRKLTTEENAEVKAAVSKFTLRQADNKGNYSTHITDVMPVEAILAIDELDISAADGYFLGAMMTKMVNCLTPIEREHLGNLIKPLTDKLSISHL